MKCCRGVSRQMITALLQAFLFPSQKMTKKSRCFKTGEKNSDRCWALSVPSSAIRTIVHPSNCNFLHCHAMIPLDMFARIGICEASLLATIRNICETIICMSRNHRCHHVSAFVVVRGMSLRDYHDTHFFLKTWRYGHKIWFYERFRTDACRFILLILCTEKWAFPVYRAYEEICIYCYTTSALCSRSLYAIVSLLGDHCIGTYIVDDPFCDKYFVVEINKRSTML